MNNYKRIITGDASLDFALEAGPRAMTPDTPEHVIVEVGKYQSFEPFREEMRRRKLARLARVNAIIQRQYRLNRIRESLCHGKSTGPLPAASIPMDLIIELEAENKEAWNPKMREHTLQCYPGLRLNVGK